MNVIFGKMHGLGNDFIVVNEKDLTPEEAKEFAQEYCDRRFGIGADSLLYVYESEDYPLGMRIFERDGSESNMCGNGIRCIAHGHMQPDQEEVTIETASGPKTVRRKNGEYEVKLGEPKIDYDGEVYDVDIGEPHRVKFVDEISISDRRFTEEAIELRRGDNININYAMVNEENNGKVHVRTFERGVDDETLSCGTGIGAVAAAYWNKEGLSRLLIQTRGGPAITRYKNNQIFLQGPAKEVFYGEI